MRLIAISSDADTEDFSVTAGMESVFVIFIVGISVRETFVFGCNPNFLIRF